MNATTLIELAIAETLVAEPDDAPEIGLDPRVVRGVELLDERMPGWAARIDLDTFDLRSGRLCVIGQVYGSYVLAEDVLFKAPRQAIQAELHGFLPNVGDWKLESDWRLVIAERQAVTA